MAGNPRLVNKQFNSPINLYSDSNVREIIERESQMLDNGAVGINFHNPMSNKPANLQNSAVLRMLEEEESRQRNGQAPGFRRDGVPLRAWPPPGVNNRQRRFQDVVISGVKRVAWPPPRDGEDEFEAQEAVQAQGGPQYSTQHTLPTNQTHVHPIQRPPSSPTPSPTPLTNQQYRPQTPTSPINFVGQQAARTWAPVQAPQSPQTAHPPASGLLLQQVPQYQQPQPQLQQAHNPNTQLQYQQQAQSPQPPQQHWAPQAQNQAVPKQQQAAPQQPTQPAKVFEPPPTTIQLRPTVPISQAPAPIVTSQPATATLKGGKNLRGDLKWPPENVRERMAAEQQHLVELSKGPACRPRRPEKDYSGFFAQHALNSSYPGYKIPPGTQFYEHQPMM